MYYNGWAWQGPETYLLLWSNGGHPGNYNDAVRQWRAPSSGSVHITGSVSDGNVSCGSGVIVSIKNGNQVLWQQTIENGDTVGFGYDLTISVGAGDQLNFVINNRGDWGCDSTNFDPTIAFTAVVDTVQASNSNTPFTGTRISIPGTIEGENFDNGGAEIAYHDTSAGSHGADYDNPPNYPTPSFRQPMDVDVYKGTVYGYSNGYLVMMQAGDWMNYSVNVTQLGSYALEARVAWGGGAGGSFHIEVDGTDMTGPIQIPDTGWGFTMVSRGGIQLPAGNHNMRVVADTNGAYNITGDIDYLRFTFENLSYVTTGTATSIPVHIDFDQLAGVPIPNGTTINNQWLSYAGVKFYSSNGFYPVHIYQTCGPCSTTSPPNYINTKPDDAGVLNVEFTQPVSNLNFFIVGVDAFFNNPFAVLDVYRGGSFYGSSVLGGNATSTVWINLGPLDNISKIVVRNINDTLGVGFDDFRFNVPADVKITSGRVSGYLNSTTQNALLGADVALNATALPGAFAGGSYSWSFTGSPTALTNLNQSSASVRWLQSGTYRATATYTLGSVTASAFVDVTVVKPSLSNLSGVEVSDQLNRDRNCSNQPAGVTYSLGCFQQGGPETGIVWSATAQIPPGSYLTDNAQAGIKFVQATSVYRKRLRDGNVQCFTARSSETDVGSGWQLDTIDPYNHIPEHPIRYFSESPTLVMGDLDAPSSLLEGSPLGVFFSDDARYASDNFEVYVFYFTTPSTNRDPAHPIFQQALGFAGSTAPYARLTWSWGGLPIFDYYSTPSSLLFRLQFTNTLPGQIIGSPTETIMPMVTNVSTLQFHTCPGTQSTSNPIDGSRFFTSQLYLDFLGRSADESGLNFWRSNITQCAFDQNCIGNKRIDVARAFFYSTEFMGLHPELAGPRGTHDYNAGFVYACYRGFLRREPNACPDYNWVGFDFWVNKLDSSNPDGGDWKYNEMLKAFLESIEYRNRFIPHTPQC